MTETVADPETSGRTTDDYAERRTGLGGGSSADWTTAAGYSSRGGVAIESAAGPINEGAVSTTAVTTPQGLPSHSERAIIAAHESNAMPTGPKRSHAARSESINQRARLRAMCVMLAREQIGAHGNESAHGSETNRILECGLNRVSFAAGDYLAPSL